MGGRASRISLGLYVHVSAEHVLMRIVGMYTYTRTYGQICVRTYSHIHVYGCL